MLETPIHPTKSPADTRVVVAMSGGVDSSVVAALLHEQGYDVVGITLQLYDYGEAMAKKGSCCAGQDINDARQVADRLSIPHYVLNYESKFKEAVMDDFVDTYLAGQTPIPCVKCNQSVKFRDLLKTAHELGADALATGHYVQRELMDGKAAMLKGADPKKDQSYFLFATLQEQLDFLRFPLGGLQKEETRKLAERFGLPVFDKPDSQDICFVPNGDYASVIEKLKPGAGEPGDIVDQQGKALGQHEGIIHYTVGQRRGLNIGGTADPLFVIKLDPDTRQVIVGPKKALARTSFELRDCNWLDGAAFDGEVTVKLRSGHKGVGARISRPPLEGGQIRKANRGGYQKDIDITPPDSAAPNRFASSAPPQGGGEVVVTLTDPEDAGAVSPGQACVAYQGNRMLGGGWICA